jgi:hypothetical protein
MSKAAQVRRTSVSEAACVAPAKENGETPNTVKYVSRETYPVGSE